MNEQYEKIAFAWNEPQPLIKVPDRLAFQSLPDVGMEFLTAAVGRVMAASLDRNDQRNVQKLCAEESAARFLKSAGQHFDYQKDWWKIGFDSKGEVCGFVLPVLFRDGQKGNKPEATIFYMGVVPEKRGLQYAVDLLYCATRVLQEVGIWRIFSDTDVKNEPMIRAFKKAGYVQSGTPKVRPFWDLK